MSPFRTFMMLSAVVVLGACSDNQPPTSSTDPQPELRTDGGSQVAQGDAGIENGGTSGAEETGVGPEAHPFVCNNFGRGPECMRIFHFGNYVSRVYSRGRTAGRGCSRAYFFTNGYLRYVSRRVCHGANQFLYANWYPRANYFRGTRFCVDWRGTGAPRGFVCWNF